MEKRLRKIIGYTIIVLTIISAILGICEVVRILNFTLLSCFIICTVSIGTIVITYSMIVVTWINFLDDDT